MIDRAATQQALDDAFGALARNALALFRTAARDDGQADLTLKRVQFFGDFLDNIRNDDAWWSRAENLDSLIERMNAEKQLVDALLIQYNLPGVWDGFLEELGKRFVEMTDTASDVGGRVLTLAETGARAGEKAVEQLPWIAIIAVVAALFYFQPTASSVAAGVRKVRAAARGK
jgi:hypothetical protein